uniref:Uncharacterized protein n=1 Tax=Panagrolaimus sp. PS1159 TaxID=55785 RepID=A0AC35FV30_9BILA
MLQFKSSQKLLNPNEALKNDQKQGSESTNVENVEKQNPSINSTVKVETQPPPLRSNLNTALKKSTEENLLDIDSIELHRKRREVLQKFPYFFVAFLGNQGSGKAEVRRACFQQTSITNKDVTLPLDAKSIVIHEHRIDLIAIKQVHEFATQATRCNYLNALIVFYNITNLEHYNSVHQKWIPAIKRLYPTTPFIICATGIEARENSDRRINVSAQFKKILGNPAQFKKILGNPESPLKTANSVDELFPMISNRKNHYEKFVTKEMGESLAKEVGAASFIEVSTVTFENISKLMDLMFDVILESEIAKMSLHSTRICRPRPDETCITT